MLLFLLALFLPAVGQEFSVMFYNAENLFDTVDDTTRNDEEFLPGGDRRWTAGRYHKKISAISRAIAAAGEWELPALIGLCEVENEEVVMDLAFGDLLSAGQYGVVHRDSPDLRGIDVALMYRKDYFTIAEVRSWVPLRPDNDPFLSRNLLYAKAVMDSDTLHVIVCHFPSRRGGVLATQGAREEMAQLLRIKTDSILSVTADAAIIIMGDFNAGPDDEIMKNLTCGDLLVNASDRLVSGEKGTYRYQGQWEVIDQIVISSTMAVGTGAFHADPESVRVPDAPFLLTEDGTYPGMKPFATYAGFSWAGGYSDHLPVVITINNRQELPWLQP
ncbi:MAG: endonuclease/exonuclease/phosphatase family protein [Bacteroidales bacterium]